MAQPPAADTGFFARWSQRKALAREGVEPTEPPPAAEPEVVQAAKPSGGAATPLAPGESAPAPPPPTLEDVEALAPGADVRRFVAPGVDPDVRHAALKKLFADPHFNVMDGLDTYIDDYHTPDPLPAAMLRRMVQSAALGLLADESPAAGDAADAQSLPTAAPRDEDPDLRLQRHDATGPDGARPGASPDAGGER